RGFHRLVDVLGADHHGYVPRVRAAVEALTGEHDRLAVQLVQFAILYRGTERQPMSTRAGQYVTLRELCAEVGVDAARYFYVMRSNEQHLDFDLELAKSRSNDNPVYYIQYAHARVCSVDRQLAERGRAFTHEAADLSRLTTEHEQRLITTLSRFVEVVASSAREYAPHTLAHYLRDVADAFHSYYNAHTFLVDDRALCNARLALIHATRQVIANGLALLGVSQPEQMCIMARDYSNRGNNSRTASRKKNNASKRTAQPAKKRSAPKKNTRRKTRTATGTPGWVWLGSGLCIGLTVAAVVYIASRPTGEPNREPTPEQSIATPSSTAAESDSASTATAEDEQAASDQQGDNPRFAFYEMLPDYKVVIPEESYPGKTRSGTGSTTASSTNNS